MGLFGFGGGLKVTCSQCDKKIKGAGVTRRQLPFCSHDCETAFVAQHPIAPAHGTPESLRIDAMNRLVAGLGELYAAARTSPLTTGNFRIGDSVFALNFDGSVGLSVGDDDGGESRSALFRFDQLALEALPFLYAIGRVAEAEQLERLNLGPIRDGLPMSRGSIGPVAHDIHRLVARLAD